MKVGEALKNTSNILEFQGKEDRVSPETRTTSFISHMTEIEERSFDQRVQLLVDKISVQGERLSKKIDIRELKEYKKLISEFLDQTMNNSHRFSKDSYIDRRGRHKVFVTIRKINEELDGLTNDVINKEANNIKILKRLEDIRGLIMDISM